MTSGKNESEEYEKSSEMTRLNNVPIINTNQPFFSYNTNYAVYETKLGHLFNADTGVQTVAGTFYLVYELDVPPNKNKTVYIDRVVGGSSGTTTMDILKNATFTESGTTCSIVNRNWNSENDSIVSCKYLNNGTIIDPTQGGLLIDTYFTNASTIDRAYDGRLAISSGTTTSQLYVRLLNTSTGVGNLSLSVNVSWWEE